jgi:hypothetical protein
VHVPVFVVIRVVVGGLGTDETGVGKAHFIRVEQVPVQADGMIP